LSCFHIFRSPRVIGLGQRKYALNAAPLGQDEKVNTKKIPRSEGAGDEKLKLIFRSPTIE